MRRTEFITMIVTLGLLLVLKPVYAQEKEQAALSRTQGVTGTWVFNGALAQTNCPESSGLNTISETFQIDQNSDALYLMASQGTIEFFGKLEEAGGFTTSSPPRVAPLTRSCSQKVTISLTGSFLTHLGSLAIVNNFIGSCPGAHDCQFLYEGQLSQVETLSIPQAPTAGEKSLSVKLPPAIVLH